MALSTYAEEFLHPKPEDCTIALANRIKKCKEERTVRLNLSDLMLEKVPDEVAELDWLELLDISGEIAPYDPDYQSFDDPELLNRITALPEWLLSFKNLKHINMTGNLIQDISLLGEIKCLEVILAAGNLIGDIESIAHLPNLREIHFADNHIKKLPDFPQCKKITIWKNDLSGGLDLSQFSSLENFYASSNRINSIIGTEGAHNLKELVLSNNHLTSIPALSSLSRLKTLNLDHNQIEILDGQNLPASLHAISVNNNRITGIVNLPPALSRIELRNNAFASLPNLPPTVKWLHLGGNEITSIEASLLPNGLEYLSLQKNKITKIADARFPTTLRYLDLNSNKISVIPEITGMSSLEKIVLSQNQIKQIEGCWNFEQLRTIVIEKNNLQTLDFLGDLPRLQSLWLEQNEINNIDSLERYLGLETIIVSKNNLGTLPSSLYKLEKLSEFQFHRNDAISKTIPSGILSNYLTDDSDFYNTMERPEYFWDMENYGEYDLPTRESGHSPEPILKWLEAIHQSPIINKSIRLILCGNGRVGKSSILDCLQGRAFDKEKKSTHAIAIERLPLPDLECWVWDFGGQEIYHSTHRLFMGGNAVYILVWDEYTESIGEVSDSIDPNLIMPNFKLQYWIDFIRSESKNSPIILVQNKTDEHWVFPSVDILPPELNIRYITGFNAQTKMGRENLISMIQQAARSIPEYGMTVPETWWDVKDNLLALKTTEDKTSMSFQEFEELCTEMKVIPEHAIFLRQYLDESSVIHVMEKSLGEIIIINDMWFVQPIYKVLERGSIFFDDIRSSGKFSKRRFAESVNINAAYRQEEIDLFLNLMVSIGLCFKIKKTSEAKVPDDEYIIPRFLANDKPNNVDHLFEGKAQETYFLRYSGAINYHLLQHLIVEMGRKADLDKIGRLGIFFNLPGGVIALIYLDQKLKHIMVKVTGGNTAHRKWAMDAIRFTYRRVAKNYNYRNRISVEASYDGENFAGLTEIKDQFDLYKDQPDLIRRLKVKSVGFFEPLELHKLEWVLEPDPKADFGDLPDIEQEKIEAVEIDDVSTTELGQSQKLPGESNAPDPELILVKENNNLATTKPLQEISESIKALDQTLKKMTPSSEPKLPEGTNNLVLSLINWLPKPIGILVVIIILIGLGYLGYSKYFPKAEPKLVTIVGKLIEKSSKKALSNVTVCIENQTTKCDESVDNDGFYTIDNVLIPKSKIISLLVTYGDGQIIKVKDIDVEDIHIKDNRLDLLTKEVEDHLLPVKPIKQGVKSNSSTFTITGRLIGEPSNKLLENIVVSLERNPHKRDETVVEGVYIIDNINVSEFENNFISLVVTYPDGQTRTVKDIDISQLKSQKGRLTIPDKKIKDQ
jgi:internalin A